MYTMKVPYKDFKDNPRTEVVNFNLTEREVFKLLVEFKHVFSWIDSMKDEDPRELETEEVVAFYNSFEEILLSAYGELSEDGRYFRKGERYNFEESALFAECMLVFVQEPQKATELVEGLMPKNLEELIKKADANTVEMLKNSTDEDLKKQVEQLRAQLAAAGTDEKTSTEA